MQTSLESFEEKAIDFTFTSSDDEQDGSVEYELEDIEITVADYESQGQFLLTISHSLRLPESC